MKEQTEILKILNDLHNKSGHIALYFVALLFAIELYSLWLIITFSILICFNIMFKLNKHFKFISINLPESNQHITKS